MSKGATSESGREANHGCSGSDVKRSVRKDKKKIFNALATEAETAAGQRNMNKFALYKITRTMSGKRIKQTKPCSQEQGKYTEPEQRARWAELSREILKRPFLLLRTSAECQHPPII